MQKQSAPQQIVMYNGKKIVKIRLVKYINGAVVRNI